MSRDYLTRKTSPFHCHTRRLLHERTPNMPNDLADYLSTYVVSDSTNPFQFIEDGNLYQLATLHEYRPLNKTDIAYTIHAVEFGQLDILQWLLEEGFTLPSEEDEDTNLVDIALDALVDIDMLEFLHQCLCLRSMNPILFSQLASQGDADRFIYFLSLGYSLPMEDTARLHIMTHAVHSGSIELVRLLLSMDFPMNNVLLLTAAQSGNVKMLDWLLQQGLTPSAELLQFANRSRNPQMIQRAHDVLQNPMNE